MPFDLDEHYVRATEQALGVSFPTTYRLAMMRSNGERSQPRATTGSCIPSWTTPTEGACPHPQWRRPRDGARQSMARISIRRNFAGQQRRR